MKREVENIHQIVDSEKVKVHMSDEKSVYLASVQNIKWSNSNASVQYAIKLTSGTNDLKEKAKILYQHMAKGYKYDYNKLATVIILRFMNTRIANKD